MQSLVDRGQDKTLVVAIVSSRGGTVPIKALVATRGVVVISVATHIGVNVLGSVGEAGPAVDENSAAGTTYSRRLEGLDIRQRIDRQAVGTHRSIDCHAGVASAERTHRDGVEHIGSETAKGIGSGGCGDTDAVAAYHPLIFGAGGSPRHVDGIGGGGSGQIIDHGAGVEAQHHIVDGCRRLVGDASVVTPHEDPLVSTRGAEMELANTGLP